MTDSNHAMPQSDSLTGSIVASFDGLDIPDAVLKCREDKVSVEGTYVNGEYVSIWCPVCGVRVDGERANAMFLKQAQEIQIKEFRKVRNQMFGLPFDSGIESGEKPFDPTWPFFLE